MQGVRQAQMSTLADASDVMEKAAKADRTESADTDKKDDSADEAKTEDKQTGEVHVDIRL